ncbi:hypothetical protein [Kitasatospora sp. NPDC085879]|uniref:hypothetical protein n=1 Tax=Kitasatospora sp. NPDC085879 TaxID=3154769 RepID=UPI001185DC7D|nr:hypothetical protein [Streptomyces sp. TLI_235]
MTNDHRRQQPASPLGERPAAAVPRARRPLAPAGPVLFQAPPGNESAPAPEPEPSRPAAVPAVAFSDPGALLLR